MICGSVDSACIYDARCGIGDYSPLFNPLTYKPHKAYWAMVAFNELRRRGTAVEARVCCGEDRVWAAAAKGADGSAAVAISNIGDQRQPLRLDIGGRKPSSCRIVDSERTWEKVAIPESLPPCSFILVECLPTDQLTT